MNITLVTKRRNTIKLRDLAVGHLAVRMRESHYRQQVGSPSEVVMRAEPCDVERVERITPTSDLRDTYVVNVRTGRAWFANGDEDVLVVDDATLTVTVPS